MARAADSVRVVQPTDDLSSTLKEYKYYRDQIKEMKALQQPLHDRLVEMIDSDGETDDQGNVFLPLRKEYDGVRLVQKTRRVSSVLNQEAAEDILSGLGLWEKCTEVVRVVNQDAIMEALYEGELTEADIDCIYEQKITWALNLK